MQQHRLKTPIRNSVVKPPSNPIQRAWIALGRVAPVVRDRVDNELKAAGLPDLSWYTVLWELERAGAPTRPRDLAIPLFIERYQLSRLVDRMEAEGLITRRECPEDQRGHLLDLTPKGRALRLKMWAVYAPAMDAAMGRLNDAEALKLAELLYKLTGMAPPF
ncbi:MAG: MarR family transcriptional regulator [Alphaproteobacteria bacterium]